MATLVISGAPGRTGLNITDTAVACAGGGDKFAPTTKTECVVIINGDASPHTVSIAQQQAVDGVTPAAKTVVVAAGKTVTISQWPQNYIDTNGFVNFTYDAVTSMKILVFQP